MGFFSAIGSVLESVTDILSIFGGKHTDSSYGSYTSSDGSKGTFSSDTYDYGGGYKKKYTTYTDNKGNSKTFTESIFSDNSNNNFSREENCYGFGFNSI